MSEKNEIYPGTEAESGKEQTFSFRRYAWKQFRKNKSAWISFLILMGLVVIALLSPILANDMPLYVKYNGGHYFPAFTWKNQYKVIGKDGDLQKT